MVIEKITMEFVEDELQVDPTTPDPNASEKPAAAKTLIILLASFIISRLSIF